MKLFNKLTLIVSSFALFIIILYISLTSLINNPKFFQKIWQEEGIYEQMNISEEELTKVIVHTMDYMWGKEDSLQIEVTLNDGTTKEFYKDWGYDVYEDRQMDELGHMADCRKLFIGGKSLFIISCIILPICLFGLYKNRSNLSSKELNATYITYGVILGIIGFIGIYCVIDFDTAFTIFHHIFFKDSIYSWMYPSKSFMIMMLPEDALFANIVYKTLIIFFSLFAIVITITILLQKHLKSNQKRIYQQS